jgi:acetate---CoA ligase (ADP-forming)
VRGFRVLAGWRGLPRGDLAALARAVAAVSRLAAREDIAEAEINPLIIGPEGGGVTVADAWVVPRR